jgi:hypothetical protein
LQRTSINPHVESSPYLDVDVTNEENINWTTFLEGNKVYEAIWPYDFDSEKDLMVNSQKCPM